MSEQLSNKEVELLQYYYKKKKQQKIIIFIILAVVILGFFSYVAYSIYSQTYWELKENKINVEYGEAYEPILGALVDTNKYSFITLDNTTVTSNAVKENEKEYLSIGEYEIKISHKGIINLFGVEKAYDSEKNIPLIVKDTTPPTIKSPEVIEMLIGDSLDMEKYMYLFEVSDLSETKELKLDAENVNNNIVGDYTIVATVEDVYGNKQTCNVPCSVIDDPYGDDVGIAEPTTTTEVTNKEQITEPTTTATPVTTTTNEKVASTKQTKKETNNKKSNTKSNNKKKSTSYKSKDFLFKDGYTMANVSEVATDYLRKSGKAGECVPLKDKDGIYIGMRVIIYD